MADPIMGVQSRIGVKKETVENTPVTVDTLLEVISGDIGLVEEGLHAQGMAGTRSHWAARTRAGVRRVSGSVTLCPNALEWSVLLPFILGADASGTTFATAETLPSFTAVLDKDNGTDGKVFTYAGMKVGRASLTADQGGLLMLQLDVEGRDESIGNAGTFPAISLSVATGPFCFSDAVISVAGSSYSFKSFRLSVDNQLDGDRIMNSAVRTAIPTRGRIVSVELDGPAGNNHASYPTAATLAAGVAVVITLTNTVHAVSMAITLPKCHFPRRSPVWNGREELMIPLAGECRASAAAGDEISIVLDSTP